MNKENFLNVIKAKRKELGYSQQEMGKRLGLSTSQYNKLEIGYSEITLDKLIEICNVLGLDMDNFVNSEKKDKEKERLISSMEALIQIIKNL
jgi:transcriptional regulator with XRE-family HTH domain